MTSTPSDYVSLIPHIRWTREELLLSETTIRSFKQMAYGEPMHRADVRMRAREAGRRDALLELYARLTGKSEEEVHELVEDMLQAEHERQEDEL